MYKKFFRMVVVASAVFATSQSINVETAHAASVLDLGAFAKQHSAKIDNLLEKYGLDSVRDLIQKKSENTVERRTSKGNSSNEDDKWNVNSLLSHPTLRQLR